jgi:hypothetical protein
MAAARWPSNPPTNERAPKRDGIRKRWATFCHEVARAHREGAELEAAAIIAVAIVFPRLKTTGGRERKAHNLLARPPVIAALCALGLHLETQPKTRRSHRRR